MFDFIDGIRRGKMKGRLITTRMIRQEYARTHGTGDDLNARMNNCQLSALDFSVPMLSLSIDDFSRKMGWME